MPRMEEVTDAYADPGTGAGATHVMKGGPYMFMLAFAAMATTTTIKAEISIDKGVTWVDLYDRNHNLISLTSATGADRTWDVLLPPCRFRTNITAAGGATTTGDTWLVSAINEADV